MNYRNIVKYAIIVLLGGLIVVQPSYPQASIARIILLSMINVAVFAVVLFFDVIWPVPGSNTRQLRPSLKPLLGGAGLILSLSLLWPWSARLLQTEPRLGEMVARLVTAGNGLILPVVMLATFSVFVLFKRRRFR